MSPMSPWGDILTEQLRGDILMDQQHAMRAHLTTPRAPSHYRGPDIPTREESSMRRRTFLATMGTAAAGLAGMPFLARAAEKGPIRIGYFGPLTGNFSQTGKDMTDGFTLF